MADDKKGIYEAVAQYLRERPPDSPDLAVEIVSALNISFKALREPIRLDPDDYRHVIQAVLEDNPILKDVDSVMETMKTILVEKYHFEAAAELKSVMTRFRELRKGKPGSS